MDQRRDVIEFCVRLSDLWYGEQIEIRINGENLIDLVRAVELPFATAEGKPGIAGSYAGLPARSLPPSQHFLGSRSNPEIREGRVEVLICGDCGEFGCWPLLAFIQVEENLVIWKDFVQPHRRNPARRTTPWSYDGLGPFVFERRQYEVALNAASEMKPS